MQKLENKQISDNFWLSEFRYAMPNNKLLSLLQSIRTYLNNILTITDSTRTMKEHMNIYKDIYGDQWEEHIPWESRHLARYNEGLLAVDFNVTKAVNDKKDIIEYYSGKELAIVIKSIAKVEKINIGVGVGKWFIHIDCRDRDAEWTYNY